MKKLLFILGLIIVANTSLFANEKQEKLSQKEMEKRIIGQWFNPYTYESNKEWKGFEFKKDGTCNAVNVPSLKLEKWEIKDGYLIITGKSIEEDGKIEDYRSKERIEELTAERLYVLSAEKPFRIGFLYMPKKAVKKWLKEKQKLEKEGKSTEHM